MTEDEAGPPRPPSMVRTAALFYAAMTVGAFVWAGLAGRLPFWVGEPPNLESLVRWGAAGVLFGLCVVIISHLVMRFGFAQRMAHTFAAVLGPLSWGQAFLLALLSGIAEELLFRGAMQPTLGLGLTCLVFMLVHWPMTPALIPWTISAGLLGLGLGWGFEASGHVLGPVMAHFTINFVNLKLLSGYDGPSGD